MSALPPAPGIPIDPLPEADRLGVTTLQDYLHEIFAHSWTGYDEALIVYLLTLGSPSFPRPSESYRAYCSTYQWRKIFGPELLR